MLFTQHLKFVFPTRGENPPLGWHMRIVRGGAPAVKKCESAVS